LLSCENNSTEKHDKNMANINIDLSDCLVWTNIGNAPSPQEYYESIKQIPIKAYPNPVSEGNITFGFEIFYKKMSKVLLQSKQTKPRSEQVT